VEIARVVKIQISGCSKHSLNAEEKGGVFDLDLAKRGALDAGLDLMEGLHDAPHHDDRRLELKH
jgi:hypothetical protein